MTPEEVLAWLCDLAGEVGLELRSVGPVRVGGQDLPARSGVCRLREGLFVLLASSDPLEDRITALASALAEHRGAALEGRYLPPAVRERLEQARSGPPSGA